MEDAALGMNGLFIAQNNALTVYWIEFDFKAAKAYVVYV